MLADRRRETIAELVRTQGPATVTGLADQLGQSIATIRRDLARLDEQGLVRRVHGGCVPVGKPADPELRDDPFAELAARQLPAKDAIARAAAALVRDGDTVMLDIGTTAWRVAHHLRGRAITVVTRNLAAFDELREDRTVQVVLLGGVLRPDHRSLIGHLTEDNIRQLRADLLIMGTSGVRPTGHVVDTVPAEVSVKRTMIEASDRVALVADAAKFPGSGMAMVCGPDSLDVVITERQPDAATSQSLMTANVSVQIAHIAQ